MIGLYEEGREGGAPGLRMGVMEPRKKCVGRQPVVAMAVKSLARRGAQMQLPIVHMVYGMPSGPGDEEDLQARRPALTSSGVKVESPAAKASEGGIGRMVPEAKASRMAEMTAVHAIGSEGRSEEMEA